MSRRIALMGLLLVGCGGDAATEPVDRYVNLSGSYAVVSVDGRSLPAAVRTVTCADSTAPLYLKSFTLTLADSVADPAAWDVVTARSEHESWCGQVHSFGTLNHAGRYRAGERVEFRWDTRNPPMQAAALQGSRMEARFVFPGADTMTAVLEKH